jgi:ribosomal protein S18 acetylase RimI-like enzyme
MFYSTSSAGGIEHNHAMEEVYAKPGSLARIEQATWRDLNALRHIEQVCFPKDVWPLWDLISVLTLPNIIRLKAVIDQPRLGAGEMVGFIAGDQKPGEAIAWIATVAVLPEFQRRGIGESLILSCQERLSASRVRLSVRLSNQGAIRLYERLGYQRVGIWPSYYTDQEDALVMEKLL